MFSKLLSGRIVIALLVVLSTGLAVSASHAPSTIFQSPPSPLPTPTLTATPTIEPSPTSTPTVRSTPVAWLLRLDVQAGDEYGRSVEEGDELAFAIVEPTSTPAPTVRTSSPGTTTRTITAPWGFSPRPRCTTVWRSGCLSGAVRSSPASMPRAPSAS